MSRCRLFALVLLAGATLLPAAEAAAAKRVFGERDLRQGMRGRDVRVLQDFLTRAGLRTTVDGRYGPGTATRVRSWEREARQAIDGAMTRPEAAALRSQVERGVAPRPAPAAPAPEAATAPGDKATIGPDGLALAPASAPPQVKALIAAGNEIHSKPYRYGGGHGQLEDSGYDCSGSMSYILRKAGMLSQALDSSGFMRFGDAGPGAWVTTYANAGHSYMIIAGLRFDTSGRADDDSRWDTRSRSPAGYTVRHPAGL